MKDEKRVGIIGGGISGLTAAFKLLRQAQADNLKIKVELFESKELGGVFKTIEENGFRFECGPDSFFTKTPEVLELAKELEIESQIIPTNEKQRKSLIAKGEELIALPDGFVMIAPSLLEPFIQSELLSQAGKQRVLEEKNLAPIADGKEESVAEFVERRFGKEMLDKIVQPMVGGIYTGDVNKLSARACLPEFVEMERTKGSIINALSERPKTEESNSKGARYSAFYSFKRGMSFLIESLRKRIIDLNGPTFKTGETVCQIKQSKDDKWQITTASGMTDNFDALILAVSASSLSSLLSNFDQSIAQCAKEIYCASSCVVNFVFDQNDIDQTKLDGFGFVVPENSGRALIACSYLSVKYQYRAPDQKVILRAFLGGVKNEGILQESDEKLIELALSELKYFLGLKSEPSYTSISRWQDAMPQYTIGHQERIEAISKRLEAFPGIFITGNFFSGVGIPKCVQLASETAKDVAYFFKTQSVFR